MTSRLPADLGDPLFNTWVINWNIHALLSEPADILNANMFHPYKNVLAFSDLMIVPAILAMPAKLLTGNPIFAYNFLFLLLMVMAAISAYLLVRHLTKSLVAGFVAGCLYAFSAYRFAQAGHLQLMTDFFIPLGFLFAHRYLEKRRLRDLFFVAIMIALQAASAWYYAIYLVLSLAIFFAVMMAAKKLPLGLVALRDFTLAAILLFILVAPMAKPYLELNKSMPGFTRTLGEAAYFAAKPTDYLVSMPENLVVGPLSRHLLRDRERVLFPGVATLLFAAIAAGTALRRTRGAADSDQEAPSPDRAIIGAYGLIALTALTLSAGPYFTRFSRKIPLPFAAFFEYAPGFKSMRVPARFGLIVLFGLTVMAGWGIAATSRMLKKNWQRLTVVRVGVVAAVIVLVVLQTFWGLALSEPIASGRTVPAVYGWLALHKKPGTIIELPMEPGTTKYLYFSTYHWKPLVNGYSGYIPPINQDILNEMKEFPSRRSILVLQALGVEGALVHDFRPPLSAKIRKVPELRLVKKFGSDGLFSVKPRSLPSATRSLMLKLDAKSTVVSKEQVTLTMTVINTSNRMIAVPPRLQPILSVKANSSLLDRRVSNLPLVMSPGEKRQVQLILPPASAGFNKLALTFDSPVVKNSSVVLNLSRRVQ